MAVDMNKLVNLDRLKEFQTSENASTASEFSTSKSYAAGAYVYYKGKLYKFKSAHAAGAWTTTDVEEAKLADDVSSLKESINDYSYESLPNGFQWVQGWIRDGGAFGSSNRNCRTGYINFENAHTVSIKPVTGYLYSLYSYSDRRGSNPQQIKRYVAEEYTFKPIEGYYALDIKTTDSAIITPEQLPTDVITYTNKYITDVTLTKQQKPADAFATGNKIELAKLIIAPVLNSMIADTALNINDFRIVNDTLYRVTANIANGGTLTVGTNVVATTVADVLKSLLN